VTSLTTGGRSVAPGLVLWIVTPGGRKSTAVAFLAASPTDIRDVDAVGQRGQSANDCGIRRLARRQVGLPSLGNKAKRRASCCRPRNLSSSVTVEISPISAAPRKRPGSLPSPTSVPRLPTNVARTTAFRIGHDEADNGDGPGSDGEDDPADRTSATRAPPRPWDDSVSK